MAQARCARGRADAARKSAARAIAACEAQSRVRAIEARVLMRRGKVCAYGTLISLVNVSSTQGLYLQGWQHLRSLPKPQWQRRRQPCATHHRRSSLQPGPALETDVATAAVRCTDAMCVGASNAAPAHLASVASAPAAAHRASAKPVSCLRARVDSVEGVRWTRRKPTTVRRLMPPGC